MYWGNWNTCAIIWQMILLFPCLTHVFFTLSWRKFQLFFLLDKKNIIIVHEVLLTSMYHRMTIVRHCRVAILLSILYLLGICLPLAEPFSPPVCPCRLKDVKFSCPALHSQNCEIAYDACGCCPKCALDLNEKCQAFGTPCKKGLVCLWDRFWYDEPLAGKCVYGEYLRKPPPSQSGEIYWNTLARKNAWGRKPKLWRISFFFFFYWILPHNQRCLTFIEFYYKD